VYAPEFFYEQGAIMAKEVLVLEFDYDEDKEGISETFGTTPDKLADVVANIADEDKYTTYSEGLMAGVREGTITGADLMALACQRIMRVAVSAQKKQLGAALFGLLGNVDDAEGLF
jgi:hypothetical protein